MPLGKIPRKDFADYLNKGFEEKDRPAEALSEAILNFTKCHPYYTQQLAFTLWEGVSEKQNVELILQQTINKLIQIHDIDYERLWLNQNQTDRKILIALANKEEAILSDTFKQKYGVSATSTVFSSIKRLMNQGYINKLNTSYELDDPFFAEWIKDKREA